MAQVKSNFSHLAIPVKIQKASLIVDAMDNNPNFPTPIPALADARVKIEKLKAASQAAFYGGTDRTQILRIADKDLNITMSGLRGYVQAATDGDAEKILSSGFELRKAPSPAPQVVSPSAPEVSRGAREGESNLRWNPVEGAKTYDIHVSHDNGETWEQAGRSSASRVVISGLPTGTKPWFRVSAFGVAGESGWSEAGIGEVK